MATKMPRPVIPVSDMLILEVLVLHALATISQYFQHHRL